MSITIKYEEISIGVEDNLILCKSIGQNLTSQSCGHRIRKK